MFSGRSCGAPRKSKRWPRSSCPNTAAWSDTTSSGLCWCGGCIRISRARSAEAGRHRFVVEAHQERWRLPPGITAPRLLIAVIEQGVHVGHVEIRGGMRHGEIVIDISEVVVDAVALRDEIDAREVVDAAGADH